MAAADAPARTRRGVLSAAGAGVAAALAGCTGRAEPAASGDGTDDLSLLMLGGPHEAVIGKPHAIVAKIRNEGRRTRDLRTDFERRTPGGEWTAIERIERTVPAGETVTVSRKMVFNEQLTTWRYRIAGFDATVAVDSRLDCGCKREGQPLLFDDDDEGDGENGSDGDASGRVAPPGEGAASVRPPAGDRQGGGR